MKKLFAKLVVLTTEKESLEKELNSYHYAYNFDSSYFILKARYNEVVKQIEVITEQLTDLM